MLRFFRRIRERLLTQNKFSKYLLYAVGEILLVVLGILIALQIDNWKEENKERQLEKEYLERLNLDIDQDLELVEYVEGVLARKDTSLKKVRGFLDNPTTMFVDSVKSILLESTLLGTDLPDVRLTGTFEEIISSGHLRLLQNTELRNQVVAYYNGWEHNDLRIEKKQTEFPSLVLQIVDRDGFFKENPLYGGKSLREVLSALEIKALFYRHYMKEVNYMIFTKRIIERKKTSTQKLKAAIAEELERLD